MQRDTLEPYMIIICFINGLQTPVNLMKENDFALKRIRNRRYSVECIPNAFVKDDPAFLVNTSDQAKYPLHNLDQVAGGIYLYVSRNKTKLICFTQEATEIT